MKPIIPARAPRKRQQGVSLFIVMVLLFALSTLMLTSFYLSSNQFRLTGNIQNQEQSFSETEAIVATAEAWLDINTNARSPAFVNYDSSKKGLYPAGQLASLNLNIKTMTWGDSNSIATNNGRYLIERLARNPAVAGSSLQVGHRRNGACGSVDLFRVVARFDGVRNASRIIETIHATNGCY